MLYLNNFIPIRVYYSRELDAYRLQTCRADIDTIEFDEEFLNKKMPQSFQLQTTVYALNPRIFPPVPIGTSMFSVVQNDEPPYETLAIKWINFPIMSNADITIGGFFFFAYITPPSRECHPWYIRNEIQRVKLSLDTQVINTYFQKTPFYARSIDYDNFVIYVFDKPYLYWRGTTEVLCVPSNNPRDFKTLVDCQKDTYPRLMNHKSYTGNSGIPLSQMKDRLFPSSPSSPPYIIIAIFVVLFLVLTGVWCRIFFQRLYRKRLEEAPIPLRAPT
jgi:hypothetical protein